MNPVKRAMDVAGALAGLVVLSPLMVAIACAIRLRDGRPVLFRQARVGTDGPFQLLKFRTMRPGPGLAVTAGADPRITPTGRWLRRTKLDELPQLLNVLRGDMSLVGPRPEVPEFVAHYSEAEREVLRYRPGLTDPASLAFRDEAALLGGAADPARWYREVLMPRKLALSLQYARRANPVTDLGVLAATAWAMLGVTRTPDPLPQMSHASTYSRSQEGSDAPVH